MFVGAKVRKKNKKRTKDSTENQGVLSAFSKNALILQME